MEGLLPNSSASNPSGHVTSTEDTEVSPERELASPSSASASPTSAESKPEKLKRLDTSQTKKTYLQVWVLKIALLVFVAPFHYFVGSFLL